jgi:hypothetical protein
MKSGERNEVIVQDFFKFMHVMFKFGFRDILTNILIPNHILDDKDHV